MTVRHRPLVSGATNGRFAAALLTVVTVLVVAERAGQACTAFCAVGNGMVLVGNNEDFTNPRTKIWFVPAQSGRYGRMYVGFDDLYPQGGMNDQGLWFDQFLVPPVRAAEPELPRFQGNLIDEAMATCATVDDVVRLFERYNRSFLTETIVMFADASGRAVAIDPAAIVRGTGSRFVQTNFHQSRPDAEPDARFSTASRLLEEAGDDISPDLFRGILHATHQTGGVETLYSNIYELRARTMTLYYFHDFEHAVTFRLDDELRKGERVLDIASLFPANQEAEAFATSRPAPTGGAAVPIGLAALLLIAIIAASYAFVRGGRAIRLAIAVPVVLLTVIGAAAVLLVHTADRRTPAPWMRFSIGPATGESAHVGTGVLRSTGVSLRSAVAIAYGIPAVRVIGPAALATRYSINAVLDLDAAGDFRSLLREELEARFGIDTHVESQAFDVLVLEGGDQHRLPAGVGPKLLIDPGALHAGTMANLASGLELVLGRPVIDETTIEGAYDLTVEWSEERLQSVTTVLEQYGLRLTPARRAMDVLVVDRVDRDPALALVAGATAVMRAVPSSVREPLAELFTIR